MRDLSLKNTFDTFEDVLECIFNSSPIFNKNKWLSTSPFPISNTKNANEEWSIEILMPGVNKDNVKITLNGDELIVKYDNEEIDNMRYFSQTSFTKTVIMPDDVNKNTIESEYKDGILLIKASKCEPQKPSVINIEIK